MTDLAANALAQQERAWWNTHTDPEFVWGADRDLSDACVNFVDRLLAPAPTELPIVDLGCGPGRILVPLAERHPRSTFYGIDVSPEQLAGCVTLPRNAELFVGNGRTLPFGKVAAVYSVLLFQHIPWMAQIGYVAEAARCLVPGGRFVVQVVDGRPSDPSSFLDHKTFSPWLLRAAQDARLEPREMTRGVIFDEWVWYTFTKQ